MMLFLGARQVGNTGLLFHEDAAYVLTHIPDLVQSSTDHSGLHIFVHLGHCRVMHESGFV